MPPGIEHAMPRVLQSAAVTCRHGLWCCAVLSRHVEMLQDRDKRGDQARWRSGTRGAESSLSTSTLNRHEPRHLGAISMVGAKPNRPTKGKFRPRENSDRQRPRAHTTEECQNARMPECQSASDAKTEGVNRPSSTSTTSMNPWCGKIAEQKRGARSSQLRPPITPNEWAHQYCTKPPPYRPVHYALLQRLLPRSSDITTTLPLPPPSLSLLQCISASRLPQHSHLQRRARQVVTP